MNTSISTTTTPTTTTPTALTTITPIATHPRSWAATPAAVGAGGVTHRPRWAALLTTLVAACAIWFLQPRRALAAPRPAPAPVATPDDDAGETAPRDKKSVTGKLNLNTASVDQLMMLPGIGPTRAEQIVAFRAKHGPFKRIADLRKVKGFGYKTWKKLERFLDVKGETTLRGS